MDNLARSIEPGAVRHVVGRVVTLAPVSGSRPTAGDAATLRVRTAGGTFEARPAASCLLAPRDGDLVELAVADGAGCWILAVLERDGGSPARIAIEGDLQVAATGRVTVSSRAGIDLLAEDDVAVRTGRLDVRSVEVRATFDRLTSLGKLLHQQIEKVRSVSSTVDLVAERLTQTVERCYRFVGESDTLRAERMDYEATAALRMHAKNAVVTADSLVKLDGGQIHMG